MFEQTFKNIDDALWKDAGCSPEVIVDEIAALDAESAVVLAAIRGLL